MDGSGSPRLLDQVRHAITARHYSHRTEKSYVGWIRRFVLFHGRRHPAEMGEAEITAFLSALATRSHVSASTQNQATERLDLSLSHRAAGKEIDWLNGIVRAKRPVRLPVVLTRQEVRAILNQMQGTPLLMASLMYGAGLRLLECARLRIKDVDFAMGEITVRDGKGRKDRVTMLPATLEAGARGSRRSGEEAA